MTSLETRSTSALFKRAEQLKRWQESDTHKESSSPKRSKQARVQFSDGCVFLAACAAAEKDEVERMVGRGADIDTANVDGLTALHQACIDDNLEMVEFLVERGADVNRGDNEGWTPLHATASCGFISIAKYLIDHGANVSAVNNDGELAIDISESDEMEEMLQKEIEERGIDCEESRQSEERLMLEDARNWLSGGGQASQAGQGGRIGTQDKPHPKTGASSLHVAAAKGYIKVMSLLLQAGAAANAQDADGWTPLHAAAHWNQREACQILCAESFANMDIKNYAGQTCFEVADPDVLKLLEDLKRKQANMQKDRPDIRSLINRPPVPAAAIAAAAAAAQAAQQGNTGTGSGSKRRSSITRLSLDDKALRSKEVSNQERDLLMNKTSQPIRERSGGARTGSGSDRHGLQQARTGQDSESDIDEESSDDRSGDESDELSESELIHARTKAGLEASKRNRANLDLSIPRIVTTPTKDEATPTLASSKGSTTPTSASASVTMTMSSAKKAEAGAKAGGSSPVPPEADEVHPWRRPASLRVRPASSTAGSAVSKLSPSVSETDEDVHLRRVHSFETSDEKKRREDQSSNRSSKDPTKIQSPAVAAAVAQHQPVRRSFVPPVRDEESETQRKAHAKRVRETRRSTQGVTLEDLKSAEQLVKKKQQQENRERTSELQQLVAQQAPSATPLSPTATPTVVGTASATLVPSASAEQERRPSWRLKVDGNGKNRFRLEDAKSESAGAGAGGGQGPDLAAGRKQQQGSARAGGATIPSISLPDDSSQGPSAPPPGSASPSSKIQRRKKPKRRSTGVVSLEMEEKDETEEDEEDSAAVSLGGDNRGATNASSAGAGAGAHRPAGSKSQNGGEVDYKKLWEESQKENSRLRDDVNKMRDDLSTTKRKMDTLQASASASSSSNSGLSDSEKREKKALEKKLSEMEEELKQLQKLKSENERLKSENRALTRVVSKLTAAATTTTTSTALGPAAAARKTSSSSSAATAAAAAAAANAESKMAAAKSSSAAASTAGGRKRF